MISREYKPSIPPQINARTDATFKKDLDQLRELVIKLTPKERRLVSHFILSLINVDDNPTFERVNGTTIQRLRDKISVKIDDVCECVAKRFHELFKERDSKKETMTAELDELHAAQSTWIVSTFKSKHRQNEEKNFEGFPDAHELFVTSLNQLPKENLDPELINKILHFQKQIESHRKQNKQFRYEELNSEMDRIMDVLMPLHAKPPSMQDPITHFMVHLRILQCQLAWQFNKSKELTEYSKLLHEEQLLANKKYFFSIPHPTEREKYIYLFQLAYQLAKLNNASKSEQLNMREYANNLMESILKISGYKRGQPISIGGNIIFQAKIILYSAYNDMNSPECIEEFLQILFDMPSNQKMRFFELHFTPGTIDYEAAKRFNQDVDDFGRMILDDYLFYSKQNNANKLKAAHVYLDYFSQYVSATLIDENRKITHNLSDTLEKVFPTTLAGFFYGQTLLLQAELDHRIQNPHKALQSTAMLTLMLDEEALCEQNKKYDEYVKTELEDFLKAHEQEQAQIKQLQQQISAMKTNKKKKAKKPVAKMQENPAATPTDKLERKSTAPQILSEDYEKGKQLLMKCEFALAREAYQRAYTNAEKQKEDFTQIAAQLEIAECFLSEANLLLLKMKLSHLRGKEEPEVRQVNVNQLIYFAHQEAEKALKNYHQCITQLKQQQEEVVKPLAPDLASEQALQREMQKIEEIKAPILTFKNRVQRTQEKLTSFIDDIEKQSSKNANELSARLASREKKRKRWVMHGIAAFQKS